MRVSLVARYASHPIIQFGGGRRRADRPRLGLNGVVTVYHRPRHTAGRPTIGALRAQTSRFTFPAVGRLARVQAHRKASPFGLTRARRA